MSNTRNINRRSPARLGWAVKHKDGSYLEIDCEPPVWNTHKSCAKLFDTEELAKAFVDSYICPENIQVVELYQS